MTCCEPEASQSLFSHNLQHSASCGQSNRENPSSSSCCKGKGSGKAGGGIGSVVGIKRVGKEGASHAQTPLCRASPSQDSERIIPSPGPDASTFLQMQFPGAGAGKSSRDLHPKSVTPAVTTLFPMAKQRINPQPLPRHGGDIFIPQTL